MTAKHPTAVSAIVATVFVASLLTSLAATALASSAHPASSPGSPSDPAPLVTGPPAPRDIAGNLPVTANGGYAVSSSWPLVAIGVPAVTVSGQYWAGEVEVVNVVSGGTTVLTAPSPAYDEYFGAAVALSPTTLVVGAPCFSVAGVSHVFVYSVPSLSLEATLLDPTSPNDALFGWSVATSGNQVAVGAPGENESGVVASGAAYLYTSPSWFPAVLKSPTPTSTGDFGWSVSISGSTVIVGAPGETADGVHLAGVAYEFDAVTGYLVRNFTSPWPIAGFFGFGGDSAFGAAVSVAGNLVAIGNGASDGPNDTNPAGSGAVFEYNLATGARTVLTSPTPMKGGHFGVALSLGAGGGFLAVGAPLENTSGILGGDAYLYSVPLGFAEIAQATSPAPVVDGLFGFAVAVSSGNLVAGAPDEGHDSSGAVWVFASPALTLTGGAAPTADAGSGSSVATAGPYIVDGATGTNSAWVLDTKTNTELRLADPSGEPDILFGFSVAVSGNLVAVGAPLMSAPGDPLIGAVWVFNATTGAIVQNVTIPAAYLGSALFFGYSVALSGTTLLVGAPLYDDSAGVVFVCGALNGTCWTEFQPVSQAGALLGVSVAANGTMAIVGASLLTPTGPHPVDDSGGAWVLNLTDGVTFVPLVDPDPKLDGEFGNAVGIDQGNAIVGAPYENGSGVASSGAAFVFKSGNGALLLSLGSPNAIADGTFGSSVGIAGSTAVVGANGETSSSPTYGIHPDAGNVYLFNVQSGAAYLKFGDPNSVTGGDLGSSVAIADQTIVMGAPNESVFGETYAGAVYIL